MIKAKTTALNHLDQTVFHCDYCLNNNKREPWQNQGWDNFFQVMSTLVGGLWREGLLRDSNLCKISLLLCVVNIWSKLTIFRNGQETMVWEGKPAIVKLLMPSTWTTVHSSAFRQKQCKLINERLDWRDRYVTQSLAHNTKDTPALPSTP